MRAFTVVSMRIERIEDAARVVEAAPLFDAAPLPEATDRFLRSPGHHLLLAYVDERPVGMITGMEMTHPDKGTEMFVYELGVEPEHRRRGIAAALVQELRALAEQRGCYGMWVNTEASNTPARAVYRGAGADEEACVVFSLDFRS